MLRGKLESVFQWKAQGQCSKGIPVVLVMTLYQLLETEVVFRNVKGDRLLVHPIYRQKQTDGEKGDKEESSDKRSQILCRYKNFNNPSYKFWHLPVCLNCKSEKGCVYGDKC